MMFGRDNVDTATFLCANCRQPMFLLLDLGQPPHPASQALGILCIKCKTEERRVVTPTMSEDAGSGDPLQPLPFQQLPHNALLCGNTSASPGKLAPNGACHGAVFRVLERGNELLSRCAACGKGDSLGMINAAIGS